MRQFILEKEPDKAGLITVIGKDFRYLRQVLRVKVGDMINVRIPSGALKNSTVVSVEENAKKIVLQICADTNGEKEKSITRGVQADEIQMQNEKEYWLFQFIPKPQKFEQIVRQATECGIKRIVPVIGEYSEKNSINALKNSKQERLERIIKEARQQSGSPVDTVVNECVTLEQAVELWNSMDEVKDEKIAFVLSERDEGSNDVRKVIEDKEKITKIGIVVGSEGGISPAEVEFMLEKADFKPIHFSVNILRCETAALYGIAAIQTAVN
ncbi:MAG: 16S rRNA (uracil(1498)-N(3))-methyltransferase [Treponema sp.]|nr:16S rRNA (uracil(1498)-N(3))-methyltransferase [Treponema sp.]